VAALIVLRFAWKPIVMGFVLVGVTSSATALAVILGVVIVGAASLQAKLSGYAVLGQTGRP
jgi:hypothetical protein